MEPVLKVGNRLKLVIFNRFDVALDVSAFEDGIAGDKAICTKFVEFRSIFGVDSSVNLN